uniref:hypothetical protein n=1 Tax=Thermoplasma acidophilum TaxID=2303 RepID=UPI0034E0ACE7
MKNKTTIKISPETQGLLNLLKARVNETRTIGNKLTHDEILKILIEDLLKSGKYLELFKDK